MANSSPFLQQKKVTVIASAFSGGLSRIEPRAGVDVGPLRIVEAGLLDDIKNLGWEVDFLGHDRLDVTDIKQDDPIGKLKRPRLVSRVNEQLASLVADHGKQGTLTLTLGGDHSLALGTVGGTFRAHPDACLIWVDAHPDINTPDTTDSGNLHGCPVSFLMGLNGTSIPEFSWCKPILKPDRIAYIGLRDVDAGERKLIKDNGIAAFSMFHVDKYGIGQVVQMALDAVNPKRDRPIHLTFDVDALDPTVAPSTGTPVRGGLTFREGHYICEAIAETNLLVSLDIMEVNPSLSDDEAVKLTVDVGRSLVRSSLGETLL